MPSAVPPQFAAHCCCGALMPDPHRAPRPLSGLRCNGLTRASLLVCQTKPGTLSLASTVQATFGGEHLRRLSACGRTFSVSARRAYSSWRGVYSTVLYPSISGLVGVVKCFYDLARSRSVRTRVSTSMALWYSSRSMCSWGVWSSAESPGP